MRQKIGLALLVGLIAGGAIVYHAVDVRGQQEEQKFIDRGINLVEHAFGLDDGRKYVNEKGIDDGQADAKQSLLERLRDRNKDNIGEVVIQLPEDGQNFHTSIFTSADWKANAAENQIVVAFDTEPHLLSLRAQTHWHHYTPDHKLWSGQFARAVAQTPCVMIQDATGHVVFKASGANANAQGKLGELVKKIAKALKNWRPLRPCPGPEPCPTPPPDETPAVPAPTPAPIPDILPDEPEETDTEAERNPLALPSIAAVIAAGVAALNGWRRRV